MSVVKRPSKFVFLDDYHETDSVSHVFSSSDYQLKLRELQAYLWGTPKDGLMNKLVNLNSSCVQTDSSKNSGILPTIEIAITFTKQRNCLMFHM